MEILYGYPIDAVVLTTGCDKTTPAVLMAASTVDIPAIVLSGGPMLDGWYEGELAGSGTAIWRARRKHGAGLIDDNEFLQTAAASAPSLGHCNTMGTASTMNAVAEVLGLSLTGCAAIPAVYGERGRMAYETGRRIVDLAYEDVKPSDILTRSAFLNAMKLISAIGGSSNAQPHLMAMARHAGAEITPDDWMAHGYDVPLLVETNPTVEGFDLEAVVEAPLQTRLARLEGRGMAENDARARIATQATDDQRRAAADEVVANDGTLDELHRRVDAVWERIEAAATAG